MVSQNRSDALFFADDAAIWCTDADCDRSVVLLQRNLFKLQHYGSKTTAYSSPRKSRLQWYSVVTLEPGPQYLCASMATTFHT